MQCRDAREGVWKRRGRDRTAIGRGALSPDALSSIIHQDLINLETAPTKPPAIGGNAVAAVDASDRDRVPSVAVSGIGLDGDDWRAEPPGPGTEFRAPCVTRVRDS